MDDFTADDAGPVRQRTFYRGEGSSVPVAYEQLRDAAEASMPADARAFVGGSAGSGATVSANRRAFDRWRILPRMARDVSARTLGVDCFGRKIEVPVMLAPIGAQSVVHEDGERATARAARELGVPMVLSTAASVSLEAVSETLGEQPKVFQLYASTDDRLTRSFVARAESAGYDAIMVTVDMPYRGWIEEELEAGAFPPAAGHGLANYLEDPAFRERLDEPPETDMEAAIEEYLDVGAEPSMTWEAVETIASSTDLPVLVKGVLHPDDARRAADCCDGIVVSNHGGRSIDGSVGALDVLPEVVEAVDRTTVVFDSGIRRGTDAIKALALGADLVMLGRPYVYGLALGGQTGVEEVLKNFLAELDLALAQVGRPDVTDLDRSILRRAES